MLKQNNVIVNKKELEQIFMWLNKKIHFEEFKKLFYMTNSEK